MFEADRRIKENFPNYIIAKIDENGRVILKISTRTNAKEHIILNRYGSLAVQVKNLLKQIRKVLGRS